MPMTKTTTDPAQVERLAAKFTELLAAEIGEENMSAVAILNGDLGDTPVRGYDQSAEQADNCHSHNFCEAEMVMEQAHDALGLPRPEDIEVGPARTAAWTLWVEAWALAQRQHFQTFRKPLPMGPADNDA